jgi:hypothetical protein
MYIVIDAFADMDHFPNFDDIVAHPALLVPQKIPVHKDSILPYFSNLVVDVPGKFNATPFVMAHNIPFHKIQARVALYIWSHSIKISPDQSVPYNTPHTYFAIPKFYLRSVHLNHPAKK